MAVAIFAVYQVPVQTPRGTVKGESSAARTASRVLTYLAEQPAEARVLVMRGEPLYYYFSRRPIPIRFDLFMPGVIGGAENDRQTAQRLSEIDQVVYNPTVFPTVPNPLADYAPETARVLSSAFRAEHLVSETAYVLMPSESAEVVAELADASPEGVARLQPEDWMAHRMLAAAPDPQALLCAAFSHDAAAGEALSATPVVLPPDFWVSGTRRPAPRARFVVRLSGPAGDAAAYDAVHAVEPPAAPVRVPLDALAGERATIELCVAAPGAGPRADRAGWASPRVVRTR